MALEHMYPVKQIDKEDGQRRRGKLCNRQGKKEKIEKGNLMKIDSRVKEESRIKKIRIQHMRNFGKKRKLEERKINVN